MCLPFKSVLGKIGDKYQAYCTMYETHAMATHHGGTECPLDRDIHLHIEDAETTGLENDNERTSQMLQLPWEDQRQKVTLMTLYTAIRLN